MISPLRSDGVFVALWSPTNEGGHLHLELLSSHLKFLRGHPVHGIMVLGSTGQFLHLSMMTRKRLLEEVVQTHLDLPILANISDIRPGDAIDLGRFAKGLGIGAVALLPPHFFPMNQADVAEYFVRIAECVELPLVLYNFPDRTGLKISLETIAFVAQRVPVLAVKQSGAEFSYHQELAELGKRLKFQVFTGADTRMREAFALGAVGVVSGLANGVPELVMQAYADAREGVRSEAEQRLNLLIKALAPLAFPLDVEVVMEARGMGTGSAKTFLSAATLQQKAKVVDEVKNLFRQWKLL